MSRFADCTPCVPTSGTAHRRRDFPSFAPSRAWAIRPTSTPPAICLWEFGPSEICFYWTAKLDAVRLTWFRVGFGGSQCGVDPLLRFAIGTDLNCLLRRWKLAHTELVFDVSPIAQQVLPEPECLPVVDRA